MRIGFGVSLAALAAAFAAPSPGCAQTFTDWASALQPGATVTVSGISQEITYTAGPDGVTSISGSSAVLNTTYSESLSAAGQVTSTVITNANRTVSFYTGYGDTIGSAADARLFFARSSDWTRVALAADPTRLGWAYQSFGVWETGVGTGSGSAGAVSVGAVTQASAIPTTGAATFNGVVGGVYLDTSGRDHLVTGDLAVNVDFTARSANFASSNMSDTSGVLYADLAANGTLTYSASQNRLTGVLTTQRLTGTATGQFYGPAAQEIGGIFMLGPKSGVGLERYGGGFGAKTGATSGQGAVPSTPASGPAYEVTYVGKPLLGASIPTLPVSATLESTSDASGRMTTLAIKLPSQTVRFDAGGGDTFVAMSDGRFSRARASDWARAAVVANTAALGLNYQSFSAWMTGLASGSGSIGGASVGSMSTTGAIPTTASATFTGGAAAIYINQAGWETLVGGDATVRVDFAARRAEVATSNMRDFDGNLVQAAALSGVLTYSPTRNELTGALSTDRLSGPATAYFYGPKAEEVGGSFSLSRPPLSGPDKLVGSFGARRTVSASEQPPTTSPLSSDPTYAPGPVTLPSDFSSWATMLKPNASVSAGGTAVEVSYASSGSGPRTASAPTVTDAVFTETLNASGDITSVKIQTPTRNVSFVAANGDYIGDTSDARVIGARASDATRQAFAADPLALGWNYQSFGVWETGMGMSAGSIGAVSVGARTAAAAMPATGSAGFHGRSGGIYIDASGAETRVTGSASVFVDFGRRTGEFFAQDMIDSEGRWMNALWLHGQLSFTAAGNGLAGQVTSIGNMSGTLNGQFYGPSAQEVGGTFALSRQGGAVESFVGGFGAKR